MSKPRVMDWELLKRVGRYSKGSPSMAQRFKFIQSHDVIEGYADSDWAGRESTVKSTK